MKNQNTKTAKAKLTNLHRKENFISFTILESNFITKEAELVLINRLKNDILTIDATVSESGDLLHLTIDLTTLPSLVIGKWDFFVKQDERYFRLALTNKKVAPRLIRKLLPIEPNGAYYILPFLTTKNGLSIECSNLLHLESKSHKVIKRNVELTEMNTEEASLELSYEALPFSTNSSDNLIFKNENQIFKIPFRYNKLKQTIMIQKQDFQQMKTDDAVEWNVYYEEVSNQILIRYHFSHTLTVQQDEFTFSLREDLVIPEPWDEEQLIVSEDITEQIITGQVNAENLLVHKSNVSFLISEEYFDPSKNPRLFVKKRKKDIEYDIQYAVNKKEDQLVEIVIPLSQFEQWYTANARLDLYLATTYFDMTKLSRIGFYFSFFPTKADYFMPAYTVEADEKILGPYITKDHEISFYFGKPESYVKQKFPANSVVKKINLDKKKGILSATIDLHLKGDYDFTLQGVMLRLRTDHTNTILIPEEKLQVDTVVENKKYILSFVLNLKDMQFEQFYWDFFVSIDVGESVPRLVRVNNSSYITKMKLQHRFFRYSVDMGDNFILYPYITAGDSLSLGYRQKGEYETFKYKWNETVAYILYLLLFVFMKPQKIWVIHEKYSETAQDNGYYFFKHCVENHPEKKVFYIIKKESDDLRNLKKYKKRVVYFMSIRHIFYMLISSRMISSEAKGHAYAWRVSHGFIRDIVNQKHFVFLQHGVLGLKKVDKTFNAHGQNHADLFITSSEFEKEIVNNYFGYKYENILVSGLARWDAIDRNVNKMFDGKREIFMMPTWRNWLDEVSTEEFIESAYFKEYSKMLQSPKLSSLLEQYDLILNFYVHPKFMPYVENFKSMSDRVRVIQFGEEQINTLLMRSSLLITDYSSIAWEAYYQDIPVLFFQFDLEMYELLQGGYMDLRNDLFGEAAYEANVMVEKLEAYALNGFGLADKYKDAKGQYFAHIDKNNSLRIYDAIQQLDEKITFKQEISYVIKNNHLLKVAKMKLKRRKRLQRILKKVVRKVGL
ncbi:CDP-glycerol glycerophosphotransferase family protein [Terribacillus saccharophilus]|uniref:CDP-glycerol glycerophosphotransferase family protein n=1 Tax=Terribacillus saccharophilus TaxID=361277 RepID=UPI002DCCC344|nr:CDP-glycerol glycerophosphotransferase family protein [Terribacillus saccharophilus]MEC0291208.1 CDP-glycerol glycerophosphotransferase family protein [Terribacillus saccharophilus]